MTVVIMIAVIAGIVAGWEGHGFYLRRLHKMSVRIRRVQQGGRWRK